MLESLNGYSFILAVLNLIILYVVLRKILFKPVTEYMEKRAQSIRTSLDEAEAQKAKAAETAMEYDLKLKEAHAYAKEIIIAATEKAKSKYEQLITRAEKEAGLLVENAGRDIELEHEKMLKAARGEIFGLALAAASKLMESNMDTETNKVLVDKFLDGTGVA